MVTGVDIPNKGLELNVKIKWRDLFTVWCIPAEVWKSLGEEVVDMFNLIQKIYEQNKMPHKWRNCNDTYLQGKHRYSGIWKSEKM